MRLLSTLLLCLVAALPCMAQPPSMQQMLQGLATGNQDQDRALREAYERGYRNGRHDEAERTSADARPNSRDSDAPGYDNDRGSYQGGRGPSGNTYSR